MKMFIEPDGMIRGGMEWRGLGKVSVFFVAGHLAHIANDIPCISLTIKIIQALYRKEYAVYPEKQGIE